MWRLSAREVVCSGGVEGEAAPTRLEPSASLSSSTMLSTLTELALAPLTCPLVTPPDPLAVG
jgi:hypothetical protein